MSHLVVSDVHEDLDTLRMIEELYFPEATRITMLGDHFDTHKQRRTREVCQWILDHIGDPRIDWLLGNHDCYVHCWHAQDGWRAAWFRRRHTS